MCKTLFVDARKKMKIEDANHHSFKIIKMKIILLFFSALFILVSCTDKNSSSRKSAQTSSNELSNFAVNTNEAGDTIITNEQYEKIQKDIKKCNLTEEELFYINLALQRSKRVDEINGLALAYNKSIIDRNKDEIERYIAKDTSLNRLKNDNSLKANMKIFANMQLQNSINHLRNFRKNNNDPVRQNMYNSSAGFYSVSFDGKEFINFTKSLAAINPTINGIRIYLAKYDPSSGDSDRYNVKNGYYTLILVGTKDGKDVFNKNSTDPQLNIQNYGQPCKPPNNCTNNSGQRIDNLGKEADNLP